MYHSVGRIAGKPGDYRICLFCGSINWYENEECLNCENKKFKDMTEKDAKTFLESFDDENWSINV
jgi:hypothetical protein